MRGNTYDVYMDNMIIASDMTITTALILIEAFFNHYWENDDMELTLKPHEGKQLCKEEYPENV